MATPGPAADVGSKENVRPGRSGCLLLAAVPPIREFLVLDIVLVLGVVVLFVLLGLAAKAVEKL